jgi:hypothetical protein
MLLRELSAIHRSDLVLVCSQFELDLLRDQYGIPSEKLVLASFDLSFWKYLPSARLNVFHQVKTIKIQLKLMTIEKEMKLLAGLSTVSSQRMR